MSYVEVVPVQNVLREGEGEAWAALALGARWPRTPPANAVRDMHPRLCGLYLARRPAHSSPEASPCCLSRPRLSLSFSREPKLAII